MAPVPDLVVIGHLTLDRVGGRRRPGGSAWYATWAAHHLGLRVGLLTSHGTDVPDDALPPGVVVAVVRAGASTVFEHVEAARGRRLRLLSRAADLGPEDLPAAWRQAPLGLLCPVAAEVDPALAATMPDASLAVTPQGWMRVRGADGGITPGPWAAAAAVLAYTQVLVVSEEDVVAADDAEDWFQRVPLGALTAGARGATLYVNGEPYHVAPDTVREVDPIGAGDVFATVLLIEYHRSGDPWEAAAAAACAGAAAVEAAGVGGLLDRGALETRVARYRRRRGG